MSTTMNCHTAAAIQMLEQSEGEDLMTGALSSFRSKPLHKLASHCYISYLQLVAQTHQPDESAQIDFMAVAAHMYAVYIK